MRLDTTYINRANTNETVYKMASKEIRTGKNPNARVKPHSAVYEDRKQQWIQNIINLPEEDPIKQMTFDPNTYQEWEPGKLRRGKPKQQWFKTGVQKYWTQVRQNLGEPFTTQNFEA